ncbi:DUF4962 domain-containing protein [Pseudoduganella dura]|nr:DUF4962 domain-containing protein [Pseudoduganella dura]
MTQLSIRTFGMAALTTAMLFCGSAHADWASSTDPLVVAPNPSNLQLQIQNPPTFRWARHSTNPASYIIEIRSGTTVVKTASATRNWYLPSVALPNGTYTWRVRPANGTIWSDDRGFIISDASKQFVVPEDSDLVKRITGRERPRSLQERMPLYKNWDAALKAERGQYVVWLSNEVIRLAADLPQAKDSDWPLVTGTLQTAANVAQTSAIRSAIQKLSRQLEASSLLYAMTNEQRYLTEAIRRGDEMAAMSPTGPTSYVNQDQATRQIALMLAKSVDMLSTGLDAPRRARWLEIVRVRGQEIYTQLSKSKADMDQYPLDSHGGTNVGVLALTSALVMGEFPEAETWFHFAYRHYVSSLSPWSGPEGGYANGTAYGEYSIDIFLQIWQPLARATGVKMLELPWVNGFLNSFMQFMPPGSKNHLFGDSHESKPEMKFMKALALRVPTPQAKWYAQNLTSGEDPVSYLQGEYPMPVNKVTTTVAPPNSAVFPTIGWAAFHSNMSDSNRTSVYFKSSPYGSFNHSHGDQNSFVLKKGGVALLTESGWYDWYDSPNWNNWYRQTKAHNAITYDGGVGQLITGYRETKANNGKVVSFSDTGAIGYVAGLAEAAYGKALTKAERRLWYVRGSDAVIILDQLASPVPRKFEWNFHTLSPIVADANGNVTVTTQGKSVCIRPISTGQSFEKRAGGLVLAGNVEDHGTYVRTTSATTAEFLMLLDVGCKNLTVQMSTTATGRTLKIGTQTIALPR